MDNQYFSHLGGGQYNVKSTVTIGYNEVPDQAIALDPRTIIEEWSDEALRSLSSKEVYAGLLVYCLADRCTRVCRWVPSGYYSGLDCIWDIIHTSDEDAWEDIRTMTPTEPVQSLEKRIETAEIFNYQYNIAADNGYWCIYNKDIESEDDYYKMVHDAVMYSPASDKDHIAGTYTKLQLSGTKTLSFAGYTNTAIENSANGLLYIFVPSINRTTSPKVKITNIQCSFDENEHEIDKEPLELKVINKTTLYLEDTLYDLYILKNISFDPDCLLKLISNEYNIKITFVKQ